MNNIIGYVKEIIGNFTATNNVDGSVRELKLNDPIYEDEFVISEDSDAEIVIGFNDNLQEIILAGNDGLLFDAALLDAKFNATEQNNDGQEENEDEVGEDEIDEPGAGEEDLENENGDTGGVADRTGGATNVNSDLRTAAFTRQEPEPLEENNEKLESHASFSIAHSTLPTTSDNSVYTPKNPNFTPESLPIVINTQPPIVIPPLPPVIELSVLINDSPEAVEDFNNITEDSQSNTIVGDVFKNDDIGNNIAEFPVTSVNGTAAGAEVEGEYGIIVINRDGSYSYQLFNENLAIQALTTNESLTDVFTYTITDFDGDTATTTLTIIIAGSDDGVTLTIPDNIGAVGGAEEQVFEHGLTDGSNPNNDDVVKSSFTLKALDGLDSITVGGTDISEQDLADSGTTPITLTTAIGSVLVLNGYAMAADGTITLDYTYTLAAEQNHSAGTVNDDISIVVTDTDGDSTTDVLTITIVDDVPTATSDSNALNEDNISVSANVFINDTLGADQTLTPVTGVVAGQSNTDAQGQVNSTVTGSYGDVVVQAGGSYTYQLDNSHLAVQSLTSGESLTDIFTYTITDSDGDTATTTLTITIAGTDDGAILSIPEQQVFERGLETGSTPNNDDVVNSSFTLTALDGLDNISLNGTDISVQDLADSATTPITLTTAIDSILVLNGYAMAADGTITVNYTYTLTKTQDHSASTVNDDISIVVTDTDGDSTTDVLTITIVDDVPTATSDSNALNEDGTSISVTANVFINDTLGADKTLTPVTGVIAGPSNVAVQGDVNTTVTGSYGEVVVQADGNYTYQLDNSHLAVQSLANSESLTDIFTYTITDSDGDTATTTLIITIAGTDDGVTLTIPDNVGVEEQVFEHGLATGSTPNNDDVVNSSFTLTALDGLDNISLNGTDISAQDLADSASTPITLTTAMGSLILNGYAMATDGTITVDYTYTLTAEQDHSAGTVNDDISIVVTDTDGDSTTDVLTITIVDDVSTATSDSNALNEDGTSISVTANVFINDTLGADQTTTPVTGIVAGSSVTVVAGQVNTTVTGSYGEVVVQADGSYTYQLDNSHLAVQSLTSGESLTDIFTYTITDSDGDTATTTLTITIAGSNDGVTLTIPDHFGAVGGAEEQVFEHGLTDGSNPNNDDVLNSSFTIKALDGLDNISLNGTDISAQDLVDSANTPITLITAMGSLILNGYAMAVDGTITIDYTYTLTTNQDHSAGTVNDDFTIVVTDTDGDSTTDVLNINIVDDISTTASDSNTINEDDVSISANVFINDTLGADQTLTPVTGVIAGPSNVAVQGDVNTTVTGSYGEVVVQADGNYTYQLDNSHLAVQSLANSESLTDIFTYTITDSDGDTATTSLTITIAGTDDGVTLTIPDNVGVAGGAEEQVFEHGLATGSTPNNDDVVNSSFTLTALDGLDNISFNGTDISAQDLADSASTPITLTTAMGSLILNGYAMATDGTITVDYTYTLTAEQNHSAGTVNDDISIVVTDTDGDSTTDVLTITIVDDVSTATSDSNALNEDGTSINVTANVFINDTLGADQTLTPVTGVVAGPSNVVVQGDVNTTVTGSYGEVVVQADGSYTYQLDNSHLAVQSLTSGESLTDIFTYTITDSDGDTATTTLTITIDGTNDGVSLTIPDNVGTAGGAEEQVFERGLDAGSTPNNEDIVNSSFTLTALDGLKEITVGGTVISASALAAITSSTPITVTTAIGSLVLNGYAIATDGTITVNYTYTLGDNQDHSTSSVSDDITLVVTDTDGDNTTDVLNISIVDDAPTVVSDINTIAEDISSISANVFTDNDTLGADQTVTPVTGIVAGSSITAVVGQVNTTVTGSYGNVQVQADGSYVYQLDNSNLDVQTLTTSELLTDIFTYTITDSDGDTATTTLTITIAGTDDGVTLTIPDNVGVAGGAEEQVFEHGLATGSTPNNDDVVNSSFTLTALDGLDNISLNGTDISVQDLADSGTTPITLTTVKGSLEINGYAMATDGTITVDYTYTLTAEQDHSAGAVNDDFTIMVTDTDGGNTTDVLTINIVDDAPIANDDITRNVTEGGISINGNVIDNTTDNSGDDVFSADTIHQIGSFTYTNEMGNVVAGVLGTSVDTQYGSLTLNSDGSWVYISDNTEDQSITDPISEKFTYTLTDNDGSSDTAVQVITVSDGIDPTINNAGNPLVIVYEGSSAVTFDGADNYNESQSNAAQDTASTLTHKLDFTAGDDNAGIVSFTFDGTTKVISLGGSATITDNDKGSLTVHYDGTWSYTAPTTYVHDTANGVNNFQSTFTYVVSDTDGDTVTTGSQTIQVDDTLPTLTSASDSSIDEANLATGSNPDSLLVTQTGTINATQASGAVDIKFSATQASLDDLITGGFSSSTNAINYAVSLDGHTLTASANGSPVFTVTITDPTNTVTVGYTVQLLKPLDHETAVLTATDIAMDLAIDIFDDDGDSDNATFNITIIDDAPSNDAMTVNEDSDLNYGANTITTHADATQANTNITTNGTYGSGIINADGTLTYTPNSNYSGPDTLEYTTTLDDGGSSATTVTITVTPIADAPTNLIDNTNLQTEEDTVVALGLKAPTQTDITDVNNISADTDNPELYGVITLSGIPVGATLVKADGSTPVHTATGSVVTIMLSDGDHVTGTSGDLTMTIAEYESMQIIPPLDSGDNITITVNVSSYEVNDDSSVIVGINPATATATIDIDVQAVTDPVTLTYTGAASLTIDEDTSFDLSTLLTETFGDKLDGSETFTYELTGVPVGTELTINGTLAQAPANGIVSVNFTGASPTIMMTPPKDFSGDITGITITLKAIDSDPDSTDAAPLIATESASITFDLHVNPIANDVVLTSLDSIAEDTSVAFLANLAITDENNDGNVADHDDDGNDRITEITIGNLDNGFELTTADGTNLYTSSSDNSGFTITIGSTTNPQTSSAFTISDVRGILLDSHQAHSSADILLDITVKAIDSQYVSGSDTHSVESETLFTAANANPLVIEVTAVSETKLSDSNAANGNDVVSQGNHTYAMHIAEDSSWVNLNTLDTIANGFALAASNEDDENSGIAGASETTMINFSNVPVGSQFTIDGGATLLTVTDSAAGIDISLANLGSVQFKPVAQFSGTITINMAVKTTDYDEDNNATSTTVTSTPDILTLVVDPVADNVTLAIKQASGDEDAGRSAGNSSNTGSATTINNAANGIALDITTTTDDTDGSESFVVTISGIPDEGEIYYDGTLMNINSGTSGDLIATDANNADGTWTIQIENFDNAATLTFIPAHNDDSDYPFDVSAYSMDGTSKSITQSLNIDIDVNGVADVPVNTELNSVEVNGITFNYVTTEATLDSGANQLDFQDVYQTPNTLDSYDSDGSETLTMVVTGLDSQFSIDNATFMGGAGATRQWLFKADDIATVKVNSPENFSGEINLTVKYITTDNEGDSATHPAENIKILVTPNSEAIINSGTTINEDQLSLLDFSIAHQNGDDNETLETIQINKADVAAGDFTLYFGNSTSLTLDDAVASNLGVNADINKNATHYILTNNTFNSIYALGNADLHSNNSFEVIYDIKDSVNITGGPSDDVIQTILADYNLTVNAITDDIDVSLGTINGGANGVVSGTTITVTDNTTITVAVNVTGNNDLAENSGTGNGADRDSSEQVTRFLIENVSEGITVVGGIYAGDIYNTASSQYEDSGIWYLNVNEALDTDGVSKNISFNVDGNPTHFNTSVIKITVYNEDNNNDAFQNDFTSFIIEKDGTYSGIDQVDTLATIDNFSVKTIDIKEDIAFTLDEAISATTTGSSAFSIVLTNVLAGSTVTGALQQGDTWIVYGNGDSNAVIAAMQAVTIAPPENYNSFDNADSDTFVFNATMTTYAAYTQNTANLYFDKPIYPLTDDLTIAVTQSETTAEDIDQAFTLLLSNPADATNTKVINGKVYIKITETYTDTGTAVGILTDGVGANLATEINPTDLPAGSYYVVSGVSYQDSLNFIYTPGEDRQGNVDVLVYAQNKETHGWDNTGGINPHPDGTTAIKLSSQQFSFDVTPVIDGSNMTVNNVSGTEDVVIAGGVNRVELDLNLTPSDPSETVVTALLDNVPVGFLVYYQDPNDTNITLLAQNAGLSTEFGNQFNQWSIPLNNGGLPAKIYIQAPENWSGTVDDIKFTTFSAEEGLTVLSETSAVFSLNITAVSDGLTLNATKVLGNEGDDIALNLNANVHDLDGSESVTVTLNGLGVDANFKADSVDISDSSISYDSGLDIYTISDVAVADINSLSFVQQSFTGTLNVTAQTVESSNNYASAIENYSFDAIINQVDATSGDDTLFYKQGNIVDALAGNDTLILSNDVGIDFSNLTNADGIKNIELIDLQKNGDHVLTNLSLDDLLDMTDTNNLLIIEGDSSDNVSFTNTDSNGWDKSDNTVTDGVHVYDVYTNTSATDPTVTVHVEQEIIDTII